MNQNAANDDDAPLTISCDAHGECRTGAVVCRHLLVEKTRPIGFVENSSDPDDLQAWCFDCEAMFEREDGMTDAFRAFNDMVIVCADCYKGIRARHGDAGSA